MFPTENPSLRDASCCNVDVVKGGAGDFLAGFFSTELTAKFAPICFSKKLRASSSFLNLTGYSAVKKIPLLSKGVNSAIILKVDVLWCFLISFSRSTINLTATDCTLPADNEGLTFFQSNGDSS